MLTTTCRSVLARTLLAGAASSASAQEVYFQWNPRQGTNWNTTANNWFTTTGQRPWVNASTSHALFVGIENSRNITLSEDITAGSLEFTNGGIYNIHAGGHTITLAGSQPEIYAGLNEWGKINVPIAGTGGLRLGGAGQISLTVPCTYTGPTRNTGPLVILEANNTLPITTSLECNGTIALQGVAQQVTVLSGDGTLSSPTLAASAFTLSGPASNAFYGSISGSISLIKNGVGTQVLGGTAANTYDRGTTVNGGVLQAAKSDALGFGGVTVNSGTVLISGVGGHSNAFVIRGGGAPGRLGAIDNEGNNNLVGPISSSGDFAYIGSSSGDLFLNGAVDGGAFGTIFNCAAPGSIYAGAVAGAGVSKAGPGELHLTQPTTFTGDLAIFNGSVVLEHASAAANARVNFQPGPEAKVLRVVDQATIRGLTSADEHALIVSGTSAARLFIDVPAGPSHRYRGSIANSSTIASLAIEKNGPGTLILDGVQTHLGGTTVNAGTLVLDSDVVSGVRVTGGTLDGHGSLPGVTLQGGTLSGARSAGVIVMFDGNILVPAPGQGTLEATGVGSGGGAFTFQLGTGPGENGYIRNDSYFHIGSGSTRVSFVTATAAHAPNDKIFLVNNTTSAPTSGFFDGLINGGRVSALDNYGGQPAWYIYYSANADTGEISGGNDVALSPIVPDFIRNGGFEIGGAVGNVAVGDTRITEWTVVRNNVDLVGSATWTAADGFRSIDLQGLSAIGAIRQSVRTVPGTQYRITFALAGNPDAGPIVKQMRLRAGTTISDFAFDTTGRTHENMGWEDRDLLFTASTETTEIQFTAIDPQNPAGSWGAVIDNVRLDPITPEPCLADFNQDGGIDPDDLGDYINCFFALPPCDRADFNADSSIDPDDLGDFINAYFGGC